MGNYFFNSLRVLKLQNLTYIIFLCLIQIRFYMQYAIEMNQININFNSKRLFDDFSMKVGDKEKAVLFAPSGSGKTTLLSLVMGFMLPDSGNVSVAGVQVNPENIRKIRHKIAWLPQNVDIMGLGKVRDVLAYPMEFSVNKELAGNDPTEEYLELLGLKNDILDNTMDEISGGEKQRIGIILCKLMQRPIMILDEPTSALDKDSKKKVMDFVFNDPQLTVLSASHDKEWINRCNIIIEL